MRLGRVLEVLTRILAEVEPREDKGSGSPRGSRRRPRNGTVYPTGSAGRPRSGPPSASATAAVLPYDTARLGLPDFVYAPDPDGDADPGEVVWTWVPYEEDASRGKDRPVLVLARERGRLVVAQMTSKDHDRDAEQEARWGRYWHDVGSGAWDRQGRPSEVRLDRLLLVAPEAVRREGATMDRGTFDGVVAALRAHWTGR
ncbi:type II toxin-antitoxin system PemK/MazF family toxin [Actinomyces faecalis]|uniref:type II toxin-antitoxin system PemK/MazF family toxin n=1 Tax=Actinomyces faecalis TaxID=2722820 RepID=UPI00155477CC|nr:type II toxin-antitoxin system PemK/MazF family toxin [Actinomyces faecalis]